MKKILILSLIIIFNSFSCKEDTSTDQPDLVKTKWILSFIRNNKSDATTYFPTNAFKGIVIVFTDSVNVITFNGICNTGGGTYTYSSKTGTLEMRDIVTTKIACQYVEWERYTIQNLDSAYSYKINGDNLMINSHGAYNLYFNKSGK
jgi:heat shock protein HslJ